MVQGKPNFRLKLDSDWCQNLTQNLLSIFGFLGNKIDENLQDSLILQLEPESFGGIARQAGTWDPSRASRGSTGLVKAQNVVAVGGKVKTYKITGSQLVKGVNRLLVVIEADGGVIRPPEDPVDHGTLQ